MNFLKDTKKIFSETWQHFLTGNSYMLPVVLIAGIIMQLSIKLGNDNSSFWMVLNQVSEIGMTFFVPVMAAFTAYSIASIPGFAPGLICGMIAQQNDLGYIGAFIGGFLAGYVTYILLNVEVHEILVSTWGMVVPVISAIIVSLFLILVIGKPIEWITKNGSEFLLALGNKGGVVMGSILGFLGGVDFGGTLSKIQSTFSTMVLDQNIFTPLGICGAAVAVPPLGMCLATLLSPKLYTEDERDYAKKSWVKALVSGFTEIVFPFVQNDSKNVVIASVIGSIVTGSIAGYFGLKLYVPLLGIFQWFFYNNFYVFIGAFIAGVITVAVVVNLLKSINYNKDIKKIKG